MRALARVVIALIVLVLVGIGALYALSYRPAIAKREGPPQTFPPQQVNAGARLATAGNCTACHTRPDGRAYAGGLPIPTSFGTIYSSNITPDPDAGIGSWPLEAFTRAMREGTARGGTQLYPAFPYDHYTRLKDADIAAIYAYLMTRDPVADHPPRTQLRFPYNIRALMGAWKLLFLDKARFQPDPQKSAEWNRGAYLVQALAHCGSCHTPRNEFGAEDRSKVFNGGDAGGWWAPPLNANSPSLLPWTTENLYNYLRTWDSAHGGAIGPMAEVTASLDRLPKEDVHAIAVYVADLMSGAKDRSGELKDIENASFDPGQDQALQRGQKIFAGACARCHDSNGSVPFTTRNLAQHTILHGPDPRNAVHVILNGIDPPEGAPGGIMPAFRSVLTDDQLSDLLAYVRKRFTREQAWPNVATAIRSVRNQSEIRSAATR